MSVNRIRPYPYPYRTMAGSGIFDGVGDLFGKIAPLASPFIPALGLLQAVKGLTGGRRRRATPKRKSTKRKTKK